MPNRSSVKGSSWDTGYLLGLWRARSRDPRVRPRETLTGLWDGLAGDQRQRDVRLGQLHAQMRAARVPVEQRDQSFSVEELDAVVTTKMPVLVVPPVGIADRVAFIRIDHEGALTLGELAVGEEIDALIADQPKSRLFILTGLDAVVGIAKSPLTAASAMPRSMTLRTPRIGNVNMTASDQAAIAAGR